MSFPDRNLFIPPPYPHKIGLPSYAKDIKSDNGDDFDDQMPTFQISHPARLLNLLRSLHGRSTVKFECKINKYLERENAAEMVFFINFLYEIEEAFIQVVAGNKLKPVVRTDFAQESILEIVKYKHRLLVCDKLDEKLIALIQQVVQKDQQSKVYAVPLVAKNRKGTDCAEIHENIAVYLICLVNPKQSNAFITRAVNETFEYCLSLILNTRDYEEERRLKAQTTSLLLMSRKLYPCFSDLGNLLKELMAEVRRIMQAESCILYIINPNHMKLVAESFDENSNFRFDEASNIKLTGNQAIAGSALATGKVLNLKNARQHPLFCKEMDSAVKGQVENILAIPLRNETRYVGALELLNKVGSDFFSRFDEKLAEAIGIYCGIAILHAINHKTAVEAFMRSQFAIRIILDPITVTETDVTEILLCKNMHNIPHFEEFSFLPRRIMPKETPCYIFKMFDNLGLIKALNMNKEHLARFCLYVRFAYSDCPYHNYMYSFSIMHFCYLFIKKFRIIEDNYLSKVEVTALLIACLCRCISTKGKASPLPLLSNVGRLFSGEGNNREKLHLAFTMAILHTSGCNFLEGLNKVDYSSCLAIIKDMLMATNLINQNKVYNRTNIMIKDGFDKSSPQHRYLLSALIIICSTLSDNTKSWIESYKVARCVYAEYFHEGNLLRVAGRVVENAFDSKSCKIPDYEIKFLSDIVICLYRQLAAMFPETEQFIDTIKEIVVWWEESKPIYYRMMKEGKTAEEIINSNEFVEEVKAKMQYF